MDKSQIAARIQSLKQEHEAGEKQMSALKQREMELQQTMFRIAGAIQVLE